MPPIIRTSTPCVLCIFRSSRWRLSAPTRFSDRSYSSSPLLQSNGFVNVRRVTGRRDKIKTKTKTKTRKEHIPSKIGQSVFRPHTLATSVLGRLAEEQFLVHIHRLEQLPLGDIELSGIGITSLEDLETWGGKFRNHLVEAFLPKDQTHGLAIKLRQGFVEKDLLGLREAIKYAFANYVLSDKINDSDRTNQKQLADLRYPLEWFPATRCLQRKIHLHVGPTNSGKTYHALQRLEAAKTGVYAGPLRLLAHEVYARLNAKGKTCSLITGEERRIAEDQKSHMSSCTVEMVPLNIDVDVAVIDEIQMIGDEDRGWAWTQALLGLKAKEVHLCGEVRTVPIIKDLCAQMGDSLEIHTYERLSPLETMKQGLGGDLKKLQKGDCVIVFSRLGIHAMKKAIEASTGRKCAVVYGSLPPETRAQQAALFNDPNNDYDILVASDAVGMGLNLAIKRIVFEATSKHDGTQFRLINTSHLKQIAGRAGRYKTAAQAIDTTHEPNKSPGDTPIRTMESDIVPKKLPEKQATGLVTALDNIDLKVIQRAMNTEVEPIRTAGILPPAAVLARFAAYFPENTPFSYVLMRLQELSSISPHFHICGFKDKLELADLVQEENLSIMDRISIVAAPAHIKEPGMKDIIMAFARAISHQTGGELLEIPEVDLDILDDLSVSRPQLRKLETLHKALTLYLWLSYRFAGAFKSQALAFHVKTIVEERIDHCLAGLTVDSARTAQLRAARTRAALEELPALEEDGGTVETSISSTNPKLPDDTLPDLGWKRGHGNDTMLEVLSEDHPVSTTGRPGI